MRVGEATSDRDSVLVERCREDDLDAFDEIVARYKDRVWNYVRNLVNDAEDAEDIAQETFVRAYLGLRSFQSRATLHTWLFRIATNLCVDHLRRRRRTVGPIVSLEQVRSLGSSSEASGGEHGDPLAISTEHEFQTRLREAIAQLPDRLRTVLVLHDMEDMPYEQIAAVVGCPLGTVKSRLFHARRAVRQMMEPYLRGDAPGPARSDAGGGP